MPNTSDALEAAAIMLEGSQINLTETRHLITDYPDLPPIVVQSLMGQALALNTVCELLCKNAVGFAEIKDQSQSIMDKLDQLKTD